MYNSSTDFNDFWRCLIMDIVTSQANLSEKDTQYNRRCLLRCFIAAIEGMSYHLKQSCLWIYQLHVENNQPIKLTHEDIGLLKEETYALNSRGGVQASQKFLPTAESFRFALNTYFKCSKCDVKLEVGDNGWASLQNTIKVRNRITHPKSLVDLSISEADLAQINCATFWFMSTITTAVTCVNDKLSENIRILAARQKSGGVR